MTNWVMNTRTKTAHVVEDRYTLCQWWAGDMLPITGPLDANRVCTGCAAKLRKENAKQPWSKPVMAKHDRHSFFAKFNKCNRHNAILSIKMEAAQKGYWGRI